MTYLHSSLFVLHILFGTAALILFWVPLATKKGQLNHKKFGRAYRNVMYLVAASGALMAIIVIAVPLQIKSEYANLENASQIAQSIRYFWSFLLYLALLSFVSIRHGDIVIKVKDNRAQLRCFTYVLPIILLLLGGLGLLSIGIIRGTVLHIVFGILGTLLASLTLRYVFKKEMKKGAYVLSHIGSMISSGIGAYTAFIAFGGRQFTDVMGHYQIILWIAPGFLGTVLSIYLTKKYARVYKIGTEPTV